MRLFFLISIVIGISYPIFSQNSCDDKNIKAMKRKLKKENKPRHVYQNMEINFQLGKCYQGKNDSISQHHFFLTTELSKQTPCYKDVFIKQRVLYLSGLSYFELKDYKASETYLSKAIYAKYQDSVTYYYYGLSQLNANKYKEALENFEKQKELYPKVNEVMVGNCIQASKAGITK